MGHDERHYPCQCKEREIIKTKEGFYKICKSCGYTFKEIKTQKTIEENVFNKNIK